MALIRCAVRFWGHDGAMEASFFVTDDALRRITPNMQFDESGILSAFDLKPQFDLCNCRQGLMARSQRVLRAGRRRFLTYDSRMSESMRLANECKADRVDHFYTALHESAYSAKRTFQRIRSGHGCKRWHLRPMIDYLVD
jgi:hypothetical protein